MHSWQAGLLIIESIGIKKIDDRTKGKRNHKDSLAVQYTSLSLVQVLPRQQTKAKTLFLTIL